MRIVFMGNHNMGVLCLKRLIDLGEEIVAVVAHPDNDDPHETVWYDSVKEVAKSHGLTVYQPNDANSPEFVQLLSGLQPDLIVVVSFRQILKKALIAVPHKGVINVHPSLLPKYRGRANIAWAIINGESKTGVTVHYIDEKIDTGPIVVQKEVDILFEDTVATVLDRVTNMYPNALAEALRKVKEGYKGSVQTTEGTSYYGRRYPKDGLIDWNQPAMSIYNLIRAVTHPYPGAFTSLGGKNLFIWAALPIEEPTAGEPAGRILEAAQGQGFIVSTGRGKLLVKRAQLEGDDEKEAWQLFQDCNWQVGVSFS
ncbi:MAG: methionyl-tRNA formyltransferase [Acidobacteria bacterium]|nr:methionyl-tRNA formyltransferase [Acidobacteriota bacterium]MBI3655685.1 methionyl-tRNA formyltransferase [Acidobacteriota bacterium]